MKTLGELAVEIARSKLGIKEATGKNDGEFVEEIQTFIDGGAGWMKGQPWCAAFASWCIYRAAEMLATPPPFPKFGSSTEFFAYLKKRGAALATPRPNSLGFVRGDGGTRGKTHHHTFFVVGIDGGFVLGIDGNHKNAVSESRRNIEDCDFGEVV